MSEATLLYGVPLEDIVKKVTEKKTVTRYNDKTGTPYQKEESESYWTICGKKVEAELSEEPFEYPYEILEGSKLSSFSNGEEGNRLRYLIGVEIGSVADCNSGGNLVEQLDPNAIARARSEANVRLKAIGYQGEARLYMIMRESH